MAKPCTPHLIAQRVQLFNLQTANVGGRGELPSPFSGGFKGGILFGKRIPPFIRAPARCSSRSQQCINADLHFRTVRELPRRAARGVAALELQDDLPLLLLSAAALLIL